LCIVRQHLQHPGGGPWDGECCTTFWGGGFAVEGSDATVECAVQRANRHSKVLSLFWWEMPGRR
jgi:hypothetical protein